MAGQCDSSSSEKKSSEAMNDVPTFSTENMQNNMKVIYYSRTFMSIIGGVIAGILGFTGFMGFIFYFLVMAITSIGLIAKAKFSVHLYFDSWNRIILDGFMGGLMICVRHCAYILKKNLQHLTGKRSQVVALAICWRLDSLGLCFDM
ncbi:hypothetical protein ES332_A02G067400v1 [Gossypium tomentosum]|uniref:ER membrane protein complex subunit 6 n=1 Tax=Gossypium tomentosum TaxID=34277 RepID=A0A5D2RDU7_GOSTO|nr:hypothetical protein ES332_A02G067400v1 [Gossypium tomentosum]